MTTTVAQGATGGFVLDCTDGHDPTWERYPYGHRGKNADGWEIGLMVCRTCDQLLQFGVTKNAR